MILSKYRKNAYILLLIFMLVFTSCNTSRRIEESRIAMGTSVSLTVYSRRDAKVFNDAFMLLSNIEKEISTHDSNSYISRINANAGISPVEVPEDVYALIKRAVEYAYKTDGLFNPAIGALSTLWDISGENPRVPSDEEIESALEIISYEDIVLDDSNSSVYLKKKGMKLDLGGIGKGYAADQIKKLFDERGIKKAIINLGGNIYALGLKDKKSGEKWKVGIINPIDKSSIIDSVEVEDMTVVTSGGYERFFVKNGKIYHHILDSSTGYPSDSDLLSATIVARDSTLSDALSTATFSGGSEKAREFADKFGVCIIVYTKNKEVLRFGEP